MNKPTVEQVAFIFEAIVKNAQEDGSFKHLVYERLGFGSEAYGPLYTAGGMYITCGLLEAIQAEAIDNKDFYFE